VEGRKNRRNSPGLEKDEDPARGNPKEKTRKHAMKRAKSGWLLDVKGFGLITKKVRNGKKF